MNVRTSVSHPLRIAEINPGPDMGLIGVTFCPGKRQTDAMSGAWDRDLGLDLDAVKDWGGAAVVTLLENEELHLLSVSDIGKAVADRQMHWFHCPIPDVTAPGEAFEREWKWVGPKIRAILREGGNVLFHCKGGLGRAGTVAARALVELGWQPDEAIAAVRRVRPGAIETISQENHVRAQSSGQAEAEAEWVRSDSGREVPFGVATTPPGQKIK